MGLSIIDSRRYTYAEYLEIENSSDERHMYWDGEIFAMSGTTLKHSTIQGNLFNAVFTALRGRPCRAHGEGRRLRVPGEAERSVYPDVVVICGPSVPHPDDKDASTNPTAVFEVLSDSTESFDRGKKFAYYRGFPSLTVYALVSQDAVMVELFRRRPDTIWSFEVFRSGDVIPLPEIGVELPVDALYEGAEAA